MGGAGAQIPSPPDQAAWDKAEVDFRIGSLAAVRSAAEKWTATIGTLLGLFGVVAVIGGPGELKDIASADDRSTVLTLTIWAGVLAGVAVLAGAIAAQGAPWKTWSSGGTSYRAYVKSRAQVSTWLLWVSRGLGVLAAGLVFAAGLVALNSAVASKPASATTVLVVTEGGELRCGALGEQNGGVTVDGQVVSDVREVMVVDSC
jgi:hypothetical protein